MLSLLVVFATAWAAVGEVVLTDGAGFRYAFNDDLSFDATSSASAACSDAGYTHAVEASTASGGVTSTTLSDAFDGYMTLSVDGVTYQPGGPAVADRDCGGREWVWPEQRVGQLVVSRKVYVPEDASFARWVEIVRNDSAFYASFTLEQSGNLGSDEGTAIIASSSGDAVVDPWDGWIVTREGAVGTPSTDPRLAHVMIAGNARRYPEVAFGFTGSDRLRWGWSYGMEAGEVMLLLHAVAPSGSVTDAAATAMWLQSGPDALFACLSDDEIGAMVNAQPCAALDDSCASYAWDENMQRCVVGEVHDFARCDDGLGCTDADSCYAGACYGLPVLCETSPCEDAMCVEGEGCVYGAFTDGSFCEDGDPCTDGETCAAGLCDGGTAVCEVEEEAVPEVPVADTCGCQQHAGGGSGWIVGIAFAFLSRRRVVVTNRDC